MEVGTRVRVSMSVLNLTGTIVSIAPDGRTARVKMDDSTGIVNVKLDKIEPI